MSEEKTQIADGVASELNAELGFNLWQTANKTTPFTTFRQSNGQHSVVMQFKNEEDCFNLGLTHQPNFYFTFHDEKVMRRSGFFNCLRI